MKRQLKSFACALKGVFYAFLNEGHMRFHFVAAFFVMLLGFMSKLSLTEWAIITLTVAMVFCAELINTAIEKLCDIYTTKHNPLIGKVKDIAAGAVLVVSVAAVCVALAVFVFSGNLQDAVHRLLRHPWLFIPLGVCAVFSVLFIIFGGYKNDKK